MLKYNDLYKKVKEDQVEDNRAFDSDYIKHWVEKTKTKRKRRQDNDGQLQSLTLSYDLGDLLGVLDSNNVRTAGIPVVAV
jgi:hypothetical protein